MCDGVIKMDVKKVIMDRPAPEDEVRVDALVSGKKVDGSKQKCWRCPECGCEETLPFYTDSLEDGYRVCAKCKQEWYTDIDYGH